MYISTLPVLLYLLTVLNSPVLYKPRSSQRLYIETKEYKKSEKSKNKVLDK